MKGITLPCSGCKQILLRYANMEGQGSFEMRCPHCQKTNLIKITQKSEIKATIVVVLFVLVMIGIMYVTFTPETQTFVVNLLGG